MRSTGTLTPERVIARHTGSRRREPVTSCPSPLRNARVLARFRADGAERDVLALAGPDASVLVLDCRAGGLKDARVVGRIAREEPVENASLLAAMYAADARRGRPRALSAEDLAASARPGPRNCAERPQRTAPLRDPDGYDYSIRRTEGSSFAELRWTRTQPGAPDPATAVSLRSTVGALQSYEPPVTLTEIALAAPGAGVSVFALQAELGRLRRSSIVLNRGLRDAVARRVAEGASLSEIALRCGRVKRDRRGNSSGETSWLARRIGQMPEGGEARPTPWIHSDTLALIAREGLCMSPHEVEL